MQISLSQFQLAASLSPALAARWYPHVLSAMNELIRQEPMAELDYIAIVDTQTLEPLKQISGDALVALAARFGKTRLIDNLLWEGK